MFVKNKQQYKDNTNVPTVHNCNIQNILTAIKPKRNIAIKFATNKVIIGKPTLKNINTLKVKNINIFSKVDIKATLSKLSILIITL